MSRTYRRMKTERGNGCQGKRYARISGSGKIREFKQSKPEKCLMRGILKQFNYCLSR